MRLLRPTLRRADGVLLLAIAAVATSMALAAFAPRPGTLDDRARAIEGQLRCPTCQGLSIADSPATSASQMRELVREQLAAGASDADVRAFFVARYGRWILLDPPAVGMDLALWLVPPLVLLIGSLVVVRRARARSAGGAATPGWGAPLAATGRLPTIAVAAAMLLALAVPIAAAVGPRLVGQEVTGRPVSRAAPSIEELETIVNADPDDVEAIVALADALLAANRPSEAVERYQAALEIDQNHVPALLGVGAILLAADRADAAGSVFDRVLALAPDQPDALLYRAVARLRLEGSPTDEVRADVERFLALAPTDDPRRLMATGLLGGTPPSPSLPSASSPSP